MTCFTTTTQEDYYSKASELAAKGAIVEWSSDKKTCTYTLEDVPYIQKTDYFKKRVYYVNKLAYEENNIG
jgi:hypothetical protein